jgi:hypothetical protein
MTIEEIFEKFIKGTDQDKAEVREFIQRHENLHLLHSMMFMKLAVQNAEAFSVPTGPHIEFEDEHYDEATCPHCGGPLN